MNTLTTALRKAKVITVQDVKELETCAGLRNQAAHGDFESLSHERAGLMEQQVCAGSASAPPEQIKQIKQVNCGTGR